jgi:1,3,6,8-tetrahydroxynaphthalene synthase
MPELLQFVWDCGEDLGKLDFHVIHTGGPRVLDALRSHGGVPAQALGDSWETLSSYGNIASAAVFDVLRRVAEKQPEDDATGIIAGFGPGITMELALGTWQNEATTRKDKASHGIW